MEDIADCICLFLAEKSLATEPLIKREGSETSAFTVTFILICLLSAQISVSDLLADFMDSLGTSCCLRFTQKKNAN
jgi:hypothetical protein